MNKCRRTLLNVLTFSSDRLWHQSRKTHISRRKVRIGSPVTMAWEVTERCGGSNEARKPLTKNWRRNWPMNGKHCCPKVISDMYERIIGEPLHFRTAREYLAEWVESKKNETELRAFWKYQQIVQDFLAHIGVKADRLLREKPGAAAQR